MADESEFEDVTGRGAPKLSPLETLRHSCAHVMADAVKRLFPEAKVTIGPAIDAGFYYDFDVPPAMSLEAFGDWLANESAIPRGGKSATL